MRKFQPRRIHVLPRVFEEEGKWETMFRKWKERGNPFSNLRFPILIFHDKYFNNKIIFIRSFKLLRFSDSNFFKTHLTTLHHLILPIFQLYHFKNIPIPKSNVSNNNPSKITNWGTKNRWKAHHLNTIPTWSLDLYPLALCLHAYIARGQFGVSSEIVNNSGNSGEIARCIQVKLVYGQMGRAEDEQGTIRF